MVLPGSQTMLLKSWQMITINLILTLLMLMGIILILWVNTEGRWLGVVSESTRSKVKDYGCILLLVAFTVGLILEGV